MSTIIYIPFIQKCPACNGDISYIIDPISKVERAWCLNENCQARGINRIEHFFGKKGLDIKGISKATIEKLMNWGWVEDISDIFTLVDHRAEWIKKPGFGVKSVDNILAAIDTGRHTTLIQLVSAIGIPKVGRTVAEKIVQSVPDDWWYFRDTAKKTGFIDVKGIGEEIANYIKRYDYSWIDKLIQSDKIIVTETERTPGESLLLKGEVIVITGKLQIYPKRSVLEELIKANGGTIGSSITGKTTILINNDNTSTSKKNLDAQAKGIPILTELEFFNKFQINIPT